MIIIDENGQIDSISETVLIFANLNELNFDVNLLRNFNIKQLFPAFKDYLDQLEVNNNRLE